MTLRALVICLCAFAVTGALLSSGAALALPDSKQRPAKPRATSAPRAVKAPTLELRLQTQLALARKHRGMIRFFARHPHLLRSPEHGQRARAGLATARAELPRIEREIATLRRQIAAREEKRLASLPPKRAICEVFDEHCDEALSVAWCESRYQTTARNGQYLGLFQMGSSERRMFGHGPTAYEQSKAAYRYFVVSGRDWSPWGCRWAAR